MSHGSFILAAVQYFYPRLVGHIKSSWQAITVWKRYVPVRSRLGLDEDVWLAMLTVTYLWNWKCTQFLIAVGFRGLMRPGEVCNLRAGHVVFTHHRPGPCQASREVLLISIVRPKTRYRAARVQSVVIHDPLVIACAHRALKFSQPRDLICGDGTAGFTARFHQILDALSIGHIGYTPGSMRGGGAISQLKMGTPVGEIMFKGRWECLKTVCIYLQEGAAAMAASRIAFNSLSTIRELADLAPVLMEVQQ